jgi:hypothetical protein
MLASVDDGSEHKRGAVDERGDDRTRVQRPRSIDEILAGHYERPGHRVEAVSDPADNVEERLGGGQLQCLLHGEETLASFDDGGSCRLAHGDNAFDQGGFDGGERTEEVAGEHLWVTVANVDGIMAMDWPNPAAEPANPTPRVSASSI